MVFNRKGRCAAAIGMSALAMVALGAPGVVMAADHLDAPGFPNSPLGRHDADINDVYVFAADATHTVLAMTTHPALGVVTTQTAYATDVVYKINVSSADPSQHNDLDGDDDGDALVSFQVRFGATRRNGTQRYRVTRVSGDDQQVIAKGRTSEVFEDEDGDGTMAFAGPRSDPFFFDLDAFNNTVQAVPNSRSFSNPGVDFFSALNTNAIVIQVPNEYLGSSKVNVWASTNSLDGSIQYDRMARPAINTVFNGFKKVFNSGVNTDKNEFNLIVNPADDPTAGGGKFRANVITVLQEFSSLSGTAYTDKEAAGLADVLLPDVLPYDTSNPATNGVFNGRSPADDVIDTELNVVTKGAVKSDGVGPHTDYLSVFPYLGEPH
jgi:Domain of unknown function (DUF4331)